VRAWWAGAISNALRSRRERCSRWQTGPNLGRSVVAGVRCDALEIVARHNTRIDSLIKAHRAEVGTNKAADDRPATALRKEAELPGRVYAVAALELLLLHTRSLLWPRDADTGI
jgi:hypothetical protein